MALQKAKCGAAGDQISWIDRVRNEAVLKRVKEESNVLYTVKQKEG